MPPPKGDRTDKSSNKFCRADDLSNAASVEQFFVARLLVELGYKDFEVKPQTAISELRVGKGRTKERYKPDFLLYANDQPRWIIDAKSPEENPDNVDQGAGYCLAVNQKYAARNPCSYFMLSNGFLTRVYRWDKKQPILSLRFADFVDGNPKYKALRKLFHAASAREGWEVLPKYPGAQHKIYHPTMEDVKKVFARCHSIIWKAEKTGWRGALDRFAKILFVKLWEDRRLRGNAEHLLAIGAVESLPAEAVSSTRWIKEQETHTDNPFDRILFRDLIRSHETEIQARRRNRIFEPAAPPRVSAGTVKRVVAELEHPDRFGGA